MRALAIALCLAPVGARAADDGLRCGQWVISAGAREPEVADKCGPPTFAATQQRCWDGDYGLTCVPVDLWTYDRGPYEFVRTLEFEQGVLQRVHVGNYGTH